MAKEYMVSVYMTTYYHEKYVRQAIESILSQKVNFDYEIVISDDASKDDTPKILREYAEKYDFIKINLNEENIGLSENMFKAKSMCSGRYIVDLSGDDYWIDEHKMQKQVNFLENNLQYLGVSTRMEARSDDLSKGDFVVPDINSCNKVFTLDNFIAGENFPLNGMMMRNIIKDNMDYFSLMPKISKFIDDITDSFLILSKGNIFITEDITVAYRRRISVKGEHNFNSINKDVALFKKNIDLLNELDNHFGSRYNFINRYKVIVGPFLFKYLRFNKLREINEIINTIPNKYLNDALLFKSICYIPKKAFEVIIRKIKR